MGEPVTTFAMTSSFTAHPGSLPTLRFGRRYRMRARAVDLAGQGVPLTATAPDDLSRPRAANCCRTSATSRSRTPSVVLRTPPVAGRSLAQLVIRSFNSDPALDPWPTGDLDERHLAPPRASVMMAEHTACSTTRRAGCAATPRPTR